MFLMRDGASLDALALSKEHEKQLEHRDEHHDVSTRTEVPASRVELRCQPLTTALHLAALANHVGLIKYILDNKLQSVNDLDRRGLTPLHYASAIPLLPNDKRISAYVGSAVRFLVERGASSEPGAVSPAILALYHGRFGNAVYLFKNGFNLHGDIPFWRLWDWEEASKWDAASLPIGGRILTKVVQHPLDSMFDKSTFDLKRTMSEFKWRDWSHPTTGQGAQYPDRIAPERYYEKAIEMLIQSGRDDCSSDYITDAYVTAIEGSNMGSNILTPKILKILLQCGADIDSDLFTDFNSCIRHSLALWRLWGYATWRRPIVGETWAIKHKMQVLLQHGARFTNDVGESILEVVNWWVLERCKNGYKESWRSRGEAYKQLYVCLLQHVNNKPAELFKGPLDWQGFPNGLSDLGKIFYRALCLASEIDQMSGNSSLAVYDLILWIITADGFSLYKKEFRLKQRHSNAGCDNDTCEFNDHPIDCELSREEAGLWEWELQRVQNLIYKEKHGHEYGGNGIYQEADDHQDDSPV
ncbi:hypothetical protein QBC43DRAFT_350219 [Cladorrhinum sp. PSN259]|nr:hypothetical protein QBC43DRAFT_350219 [Cladorrhinum sp. PSN259]